MSSKPDDGHMLPVANVCIRVGYGFVPRPQTSRNNKRPMTSANKALFSNAMTRGEVECFLVGDPAYFYEARNDFTEPQNVEAAFDALVIPLWKQTRDRSIPESMEAGLIRVLREHTDQNRSIYAATNWVWYYRYCLRKKNSEPGGPYDDLFEMDLAPVATLLRDKLDSTRDALVRDLRWSGASWNSPDGLWTPLLRLAQTVRDKLAGPDFVPASK